MLFEPLDAEKLPSYRQVLVPGGGGAATTEQTRKKTAGKTAGKRAAPEKVCGEGHERRLPLKKPGRLRT
jgi:hypothetical protein